VALGKTTNMGELKESLSVASMGPSLRCLYWGTRNPVRCARICTRTTGLLLVPSRWTQFAG